MVGADRLWCIVLCGTCVSECEDRVSWNRGQTSVFIQLTLQSREWVTKEDFQLWSDCIRSESAMGGHRGEEKGVLKNKFLDWCWLVGVPKWGETITHITVYCWDWVLTRFWRCHLIAILNVIGFGVSLQSGSSFQILSNEK